jgi:hypothetical protein
MPFLFREIVVSSILKHAFQAACSLAKWCSGLEARLEIGFHRQVHKRSMGTKNRSQFRNRLGTLWGE